MDDDRRNPEMSPELGGESTERLSAGLEALRKLAEPMTDRLAEEYELSRDDVTRLAVVFFGRYLDVTRSQDTIVLVVKGQVTPYESALQVLVSGDPQFAAFDELLDRLA